MWTIVSLHKESGTLNASSLFYTKEEVEAELAKISDNWKKENYHEIVHIPSPREEKYRELFKLHDHEILARREQVEELPFHILEDVALRKFYRVKVQLKKLFIENNIDLNQYPKISKAFGFASIDLEASEQQKKAAAKKQEEYQKYVEDTKIPFKS